MEPSFGASAAVEGLIFSGLKRGLLADEKPTSRYRSVRGRPVPFAHFESAASKHLDGPALRWHAVPVRLDCRPSSTLVSM
jgi:hypothetical protein